MLPGPPTPARSLVPTLNRPALYCPDQACLLKRGCGWLLCKHKSPWEIKISLTRCTSHPPWAHGWCDAITQPRPGSLNGPLSRSRISSSAWILSSSLCQFWPCLVSFPAAWPWRSFLPALAEAERLGPSTPAQTSHVLKEGAGQIGCEKRDRGKLLPVLLCKITGNALPR